MPEDKKNKISDEQEIGKSDKPSHSEIKEKTDKETMTNFLNLLNEGCSADDHFLANLSKRPGS